MNRERLRTTAFFAAGTLLLAQFVLQQIEEGVDASGVVLIAAAGIFLGLGIVRIRAPRRTDQPEEGLGVVEVALLALVGVLAVITLGLAGLVLI